MKFPFDFLSQMADGIFPAVFLDAAIPAADLTGQPGNSTTDAPAGGTAQFIQLILEFRLVAVCFPAQFLQLNTNIVAFQRILAAQASLMIFQIILLCIFREFFLQSLAQPLFGENLLLGKTFLNHTLHDVIQW